MLATVLGLLVTFVTIGGGVYLVLGAVALAGALRDQNGPATQSSIWQIVGGGLIIAAAQIFNQIAVP